MHNKNIIHIEGSEYWGRYIYLTAAQGFALVKLMFDNRCGKGVCEIGEVNTHPCKQRQGYATMLMQEAERIAKENGCTVIQLWTKKDSWMQEWYERIGYEVQDFMKAPSDDTIWLCKFIKD